MPLLSTVYQTGTSACCEAGHWRLWWISHCHLRYRARSALSFVHLFNSIRADFQAIFALGMDVVQSAMMVRGLFQGLLGLITGTIGNFVAIVVIVGYYLCVYAIRVLRYQPGRMACGVNPFIR